VVYGASHRAGQLGGNGPPRPSIKHKPITTSRYHIQTSDDMLAGVVGIDCILVDVIGLDDLRVDLIGLVAHFPRGRVMQK
jgi:hypothetical protein